MSQVIEIKSKSFRINVHGVDCTFIPMQLYMGNNLLPLPRHIKRNQLCWYVNRKYVSYKMIKEIIKND